MVNTLKHLIKAALLLILIPGVSQAAVKLYSQSSQPASCNSGDMWIDTDGTSGERVYTCETNTWVKNLGVGPTSNPSFLSLNVSGGNLAAANKQVTKAWATGLPYTANLTSVIYGGKHYICTSTHTAGSTTEPGVGASWATVWSEVAGTSGATAIDDLTDVDTTGKATGKVLKFDASGNLVVGTDDTGSGSVPSGTVNGQLLVWSTDQWVASSVPTWNQNTTGTAAGITGYTISTSVGAVGSDTVFATEQGIREALNLKANATSISFVAGALTDMKILDTAQPVNGSVWVDDTLAYEATDDEKHLWSIAKVGQLLAGKQATLGANAYQAYDANLITWPSAVSATEVGYLDGATSSIQTQLGTKAPLDTATVSSTSTGTGNILLDGNDGTRDYNYSNGSSAATYTPIFTTPPASGKVRGIIATFGGGSGVCTMTWTNVTRWIGTTGSGATTTNKRSTYAFFVYNGEVVGKIVQEAY